MRNLSESKRKAGKIVLMFAAAVFLCGLGAASGALAQNQCRPLLIQGKKALYQRVVTHPGAILYTEPQTMEAVRKGRITPFSVLYVYERNSPGDAEWLQVGYDSQCEIAGWVQASYTSEWEQSLTLKFTERMGRSPVLFSKGWKTSSRWPEPKIRPGVSRKWRKPSKQSMKAARPPTISR